jgi:hypothetical protein
LNNIIAVLLAAVLLAAQAPFAGAEATTPGLLFTSQSPYWKVGKIDPKLSALCALQRFNPVNPARLYARFAGPAGPNILAAAKGSGLNLHDPQHRGDPAKDYWFLLPETTSCEVWSSRVPPQ